MSMYQSYSELSDHTVALRRQLVVLKSKEKDLQFDLYRISSAKSYQWWLKFLKVKWLFISILKMSLNGKLWSKLRHFWYLLIHDFRLFTLKLSLYQAELHQLQFSQLAQNSLEVVLPRVDIVIPWYGDATIFELLPRLSQEDPNLLHSVIVVNDATPAKELVKKLSNLVKELSTRSDITFTLLHNRQNVGFVKTSNKGLSSTHLDVVLMNSDVKPIGEWLRELLKVAHSQSKIGTVTPLSNNATIFSMPVMDAHNIDHDPEKTAELIKRTSPVSSLEVPTAHGFCMFINRECLERFGGFDEEVFGKGYCEENDLSQRYLEQGYLNLIATKSYVVHLEGQSFTPQEREAAIAKNFSHLLSRYQHYQRDIHSFIFADPLQDTRKALRFFQSHPSLMSQEAMMVVLHQNPFRVIGGVERETLSLLKHLQHQHPEKLILLYYFENDTKQLKLLTLQNYRIVKLFSFAQSSQPSEIFHWILNIFNVQLVMIEHLQRHHLDYVSILKSRKIRHLLFIHDFYFYCQVPDLINAEGVFCNYEENTEICDQCLAAQLSQFTPQAQWRKAAREVLTLADHVVFNSEFTKQRFFKLYHLTESQRYLTSFPDLSQVDRPHAR